MKQGYAFSANVGNSFSEYGIMVAIVAVGSGYFINTVTHGLESGYIQCAMQTLSAAFC